MKQKHLHTSDLARAVGIHPNTQRHLDCLRLARMIYAAPYPGRGFRALSNEIIQSAVAEDWQDALGKADKHMAAIKADLNQAETAADLLEHWAQTMTESTDEEPLAIGDVSKLLGISLDVIRNAERNGLITVPRNSYNRYRLFRKWEIERLRIIRMLSKAGYSHMAILRMFLELDAGNTSNLKQILDTPRPDEDIFTAADRWLTTLHEQKKVAEQVMEFVEQIIASQSSETP